MVTIEQFLSLMDLRRLLMQYKNGNGARYQPFIKGELVNLSVPNQLAIDEDGWAEWFNNTAELQATEHGIYPNHRNSQQRFLESLADDRTKIVLLTCDPVSGKAFGVISLQNINLRERAAEIAMNSAGWHKQNVHPLATLEAMARLTQHGFDQLGLIRIYAGHAFPILRNWNKMMELIGFRTEGISKDSHVRGHHIEDLAQTCCLYKNYIALKDNRGSLWGSAKLIRETLKYQPKKSYAELLSEQMDIIEEEHFKFLLSD